MRAEEKARSRVVMKFGGTSVANIERIRAVAQRVKREADLGHEVAVVVSAMSGATNQMVAWCSELSAMHDAREYDAGLSPTQTGRLPAPDRSRPAAQDLVFRARRDATSR